jgi:hypothetical protein
MLQSIVWHLEWWQGDQFGNYKHLLIGCLIAHMRIFLVTHSTIQNNSRCYKTGLGRGVIMAHKKKIQPGSLQSEFWQWTCLQLLSHSLNLSNLWLWRFTNICRICIETKTSTMYTVYTVHSIVTSVMARCQSLWAFRGDMSTGLQVTAAVGCGLLQVWYQ